ncbi:hypothetical protein EJ02DRAFT_298220, partial [Clathrospora elynae]
FKTAEWKAFLLVYGPAFLLHAIPPEYYKNFKDLSDLYSLLLNRTTSHEDIRRIRKLSTRFVRQYQYLFYTQFNNMGTNVDNLPRLQVCTLQPHSLLHLADDVENWGPASTFAQWLPE